jgi:hypothetical protein
MTQSDGEAPLANDILRGAEQIAAFLFGDRNQRRRIYWLVQNQSLPVFRIGRTICARQSTLSEWISMQEGRGRVVPK